MNNYFIIFIIVTSVLPFTRTIVVNYNEISKIGYIIVIYLFNINICCFPIPF